jgi:Restriction endonuclease
VGNIHKSVDPIKAIISLFLRKEATQEFRLTHRTIETRYYPSPSIHPDYIINHIDNMNGTEFELYVCGLLHNTPGYSKVLHTGGRADNGIDVRALHNNVTHIAIQCKNQRNNIPSKVIRELNGSLLNGEIGMLITNAGLTNFAMEFAARAGIRVVSRDELFQWIKQINATALSITPCNRRERQSHPRNYS